MCIYITYYTTERQAIVHSSRSIHMKVYTLGT
jgi:hypothetical protein